MGFVDHLSDKFEVTSTRKSSRKAMQTVEIMVEMDCDGCEKRVRKAVSSIKGAESVEIDRNESRVTVKGYVEPNKVLRKVQRTGKSAEFWPYVRYDLVAYPYAHEAYDEVAPQGYVRNVPQALLPNPTTERFTTMFSDENPNACSIM
ncbi:heavy metal-associated isoprenylated plant protein 20-like [Ipomoea triloba]|uniref:heavy metal-associated isoprenylated plant protein 20-like n=1 Tax=Ipomoea triloba TaxID=35885 RepID=UPI00125CD574|nr:heavy metal-associated isoprenylated plant protein 20-like [Ipomoea triloba]